MVYRTKHFGESLVDAGVITKEQRKEALLIQKEHPYRTIGDIVSSTFHIPTETVESVFVRSILIPAINQMLINSFHNKRINTNIICNN